MRKGYLLLQSLPEGRTACLSCAQPWGLVHQSTLSSGPRNMAGTSWFQFCFSSRLLCWVCLNVTGQPKSQISNVWPQKGKTRAVSGKALLPRFLESGSQWANGAAPVLYRPTLRSLRHLVAQAQGLVQLLYVRFLCLLGFLVLFLLVLQSGLQFTATEGKSASFLHPAISTRAVPSLTPLTFFSAGPQRLLL